MTAVYRQNLADAARSDETLQKLVDDNQRAFAAVGLGSLPDTDGIAGWVRSACLRCCTFTLRRLSQRTHDR
jgi:hypothetical protein